MLTNGDLGELLRSAAREEKDHRRRALERASRASRFWPEECRTLDADPAWESTPCADLQMHTTWSDGTVSLEDMVEVSRSLGRTFLAVTDHSQALTIANGMSAAELAEQARVIDAMNRGFEEEGDAFRVLRSMEVDLFPDGTLDMDDESLASLDLAP